MATTPAQPIRQLKKEITNPFKPATAIEKRCKLFVYGDTGAGKTWLSLQFPGVVMLDFDGGFKLYGDLFSFDVKECFSLEDLEEAIAFLATGNHNYQTLVIDPISVLCDMHITKWNDVFMEYNPSSSGHKSAYYDLTQRDWAQIKNDFKRIIRLITSLDMNIVATGREKAKYEKSGREVREVGVTFDAEKKLPHAFDCVIQILFDPIKDTRKAVVFKDRAGLITNAAGGKKVFPVDYGVFERAYPNLADAAKKSCATQEQIFTFESYVKLLKIPKEAVDARLSELGVTEFGELDIMEAQEAIKKLERAYNKTKVI